MFRNEHQFTGLVAASLRAAGFEVRREVRVRGRQRLDILAIREALKYGVEVKFEKRGLLDDLYKARGILRLPDVDEMYVCGPKVFMSDDVRALATSLGVGLLAIGDAGELDWLVKSKRLEPPRLILNGGYAKPRGKERFDTVRPGGKVVFIAAVFNNGEKTAVNVEVFMVPAGPFVTRTRSKARVKKPFLERSGNTAWSTRLECQVKAGTQPGKQLLMISVTADNAARDDDTVPYEVLPP